MGGRSPKYRERTDIIRKYSIPTQQWEELEIKLPHKITEFGHVITKDERFIIIMGGYGGIKEYYQDTIFILDLYTMQFSKSDIRLPFAQECEAIIMESKDENNLLVHGYIRKETEKFNNLFIPFALISLLSIWHSIEYLHIMNSTGCFRDHEIGEHWEINLNKILDSVTSDVVYCICNGIMHKSKICDIYTGGYSICDICDTKIKSKENTVYHCFSINKLHPSGYDMCLDCAADKATQL